MHQETPLPILKGLRHAVMDGIQQIGDPFWFDSNLWVFEIRLKLGLNKEELKTPFPVFSHWFVVVESSYPFGNVSIFPSKNNGIKETYPHQSLNIEGTDHCPWRLGKLCLDSAIHALGFAADNPDPIGDNEERIRWHLQRALGWIRAAATNTLVINGNPFEIPSYSQPKDLFRWVHDESPQTFALWNHVTPGEWGYVIWDTISEMEHTAFAVCYYDKARKLVRSTLNYDEHKHVLENSKCFQGVWWYWDKPVVLPPWQAPCTWKDLRTIGKSMGIDVDYSLRGMAKFLRGSKFPPMLIGYPIPKRYGEQPSEIYWKTILLPELKPSGKPPNGFRSNEEGYWRRDRTTGFADQEPIAFDNTENWHPDRTQARGRLSEKLRNSKIALIGNGGFGSLIAELLVRGGVKDTLLIDQDDLTMGNLVRHSLSGQEIGKNKAKALASRLLSVAPFSKITPYGKSFPAERSAVIQLLEDRDIIIDCTAEDEVLLELSLGWWSMQKTFLSASVGYKAKRTFLFAHQGHGFPVQDFHSTLNPFLQEERTYWAGEGETIEGAGCWSPLFPARLDDLFLSASATIKFLEELVEKKIPDTRLVIFEQEANADFQGLKRTDAIVATMESE